MHACENKGADRACRARSAGRLLFVAACCLLFATDSVSGQERVPDLKLSAQLFHGESTEIGVNVSCRAPLGDAQRRSCTAFFRVGGGYPASPLFVAFERQAVGAGWSEEVLLQVPDHLLDFSRARTVEIMLAGRIVFRHRMPPHETTEMISSSVFAEIRNALTSASMGRISVNDGRRYLSWDLVFSVAQNQCVNIVLADSAERFARQMADIPVSGLSREATCAHFPHLGEIRLAPPVEFVRLLNAEIAYQERRVEELRRRANEPVLR